MSVIKFAVEVPEKHLKDVELYVDFHFAIATTLLEHPVMCEYYRRAAAEHRAGRSNKFVMLDNGAFEANAKKAQPVPLTAEQLIELADVVQPQVLWAPDHPYDAAITNKLAEEFYQMCYSKYEGRLPWDLGFIPQGRTAEEIAESWLTYGWKYTWIGLSFLNDRDSVLRLVGSRVCHYKIHMLGLSSLQELLTWPRCIQHVDTSKPVKAAYLNTSLPALKKGAGLLLPTDEIQDLHLLKINLVTMRSLCER